MNDGAYHAMDRSPRQPAATTNAGGQPRGFGVEIELGGLDLDQITSRIQQVAGGQVERFSNYEAMVHGTRIGDVGVELDARLFTDLEIRGMLDKLGLDDIQINLSETVVEFRFSGLTTPPARGTRRT